MIEYLAMVPHGEEIINSQDNASVHLKKSMLKLKKEVLSKNLDTFVVVTPHNIRISDHIGIILTEYTAGNLGKIRRNYDCDRELATLIYNAAKPKLPVVGVNFGALEGESSKITLDWGSFIPLYFLNRGKKVVIITPARDLTAEQLIEFGSILGSVTEKYGKKVGIIISADQAHTHLKSGPYGSSKYARVYDNFVKTAFEQNRIDSIKCIDHKIIEHAKPDSFWQILILIGILHVNKYRVKYIDYQCPTYYGMMIASFAPP
ncbi:MAG: extradiol dioxygenase [Thermoplasmata archaeon]